MSTPLESSWIIRKRQVRIRQCQIIVYLHLMEKHGPKLELQDGTSRTSVGMTKKSKKLKGEDTLPYNGPMMSITLRRLSLITMLKHAAESK